MKLRSGPGKPCLQCGFCEKGSLASKNSYTHCWLEAWGPIGAGMWLWLAFSLLLVYFSRSLVERKFGLMPLLMVALPPVLWELSSLTYWRRRFHVSGKHIRTFHIHLPPFRFPLERFTGLLNLFFLPYPSWSWEVYLQWKLMHLWSTPFLSSIILSVAFTARLDLSFGGRHRGTLSCLGRTHYFKAHHRLTWLTQNFCEGGFP